MNLWPDVEVFQRQLFAWTIRGACCAAPSAFWALLTDFSRPAHCLAMAAGVATFVVVYAWINALPGYSWWVDPDGLGWALRIAANTRAALAPLMAFGPDLWLGFGAMEVVNAVSGATVGHAVFQGHAGDMPDLFGWTYVLTLLQGGLVSVTIGLLAAGLWLARGLWRKRETALRYAFGAGNVRGHGPIGTKN